MERHLALAKFYQVAEGIRKSNHKSRPVNAEKKGHIQPSGCNTMCLLLKHEKLNQRSIAKLLGLSAQAVSEIIKKLEGVGYVDKVYGVQNNENIIVLTQSGKERAIEMDAGIKKHAQSLFENFSDEEVVQFMEYLERLST